MVRIPHFVGAVAVGYVPAAVVVDALFKLSHGPWTLRAVIVLREGQEHLLTSTTKSVYGSTTHHRQWRGRWRHRYIVHTTFKDRFTDVQLVTAAGSTRVHTDGHFGRGRIDCNRSLQR